VNPGEPRRVVVVEVVTKASERQKGVLHNYAQPRRRKQKKVKV